MLRTRAAVLAGAMRAVETYGTRRTTMGEVATMGGVAKATVYNHFRTKADVYAALVEAEVRTIVRDCLPLVPAGPDGLHAALVRAAERLAAHPALRRVVLDEPAAVAALVTPSAAAGWTAAREGVLAALLAAGMVTEPAAVETVLRWLASQLVWPTGPGAADVGARVLVTGLPAVASIGGAGSAEPAEPAEPARPAVVAGLGWPG